MRIEIMNRLQAVKASQTANDKLAILSITDCDSRLPVFNGVRYVLMLRFDDVESGSCNCITKTDANKIVDFVRQLIECNCTKLIVHCEAGISRSSGVAAAIMKVINDDDWDVFNNPRYCPNITCYRTVLEAFGDEVSIQDIANRRKANKAALQKTMDDLYIQELFE